MTSTLPAGEISAPMFVDAEAEYLGSIIPAAAEASSWVVPQPRGAFCNIDVAAQGPGPGSIYPRFSLAQVGGAVRVTIDDAGPGELVVSARYVGDTFGDVRGGATVTGPPGVPSVSWSVPPFSGSVGPECSRFPVLPDGPVVFDVTFGLTALVNARSTSGRFAVQVQFVPAGAPTAATVLPTHPGCGPVLFGTDDTTAGVHELEFTVHDAIPRAPLVLVFGVEEAFIPLRGPCSLRTEPVNGVLQFADKDGTARFPLTLPAAVPRALILMQGVSFNASGAIRTSNLLEVEFGDC